MSGKGGKLGRVALNERTARVVCAVAAGRDRGVLFERQDRWRTRHGHDAPPIPYTQQAISWLLVDLAHVAGLLGIKDGEVDQMHPTGSADVRHDAARPRTRPRGRPGRRPSRLRRHDSAVDRRRDAYRTHPTHKLVL